MKAALVFIALVLFSTRGFGCLGDTPDSAEERYGLPKSEKPFLGRPMIEGAHEKTYEYEGWRIRCCFLLASNGTEYVVREEYRKIWNAQVEKKGGIAQIRDFERDAVLIAENGGWQQTLFNPSQAKMIPANIAAGLQPRSGNWIRRDGAVAVADADHIVFNLPQAWHYEAELLAIKQQKERFEATRIYRGPSELGYLSPGGS